MSVYPFIEAEKQGRHNVKRACELLKVSRVAYYARAGQPSGRDRDDAELTAWITAEHKRSKGRHGAPRINAELCRQGRRHSRKRISRLMRQAGLAGWAPKRWRKTTIPDPAAAARPDAIRRTSPRTRSGSTSGGAGTSLHRHLGEGWLYLSVIDIASRRVVGFALADHLRTELVADALANAAAARDPGAGVIFRFLTGRQPGPA